MKSKFVTLSVAIGLLLATLISCDPKASKKTIGNSRDTTSVNKGGGPPIRDTATISKDRRDSAKVPAKKNTSKGNADPSGHLKNQ
jgi:hypothetical protein